MTIEIFIEYFLSQKDAIHSYYLKCGDVLEYYRKKYDESDARILAVSGLQGIALNYYISIRHVIDEMLVNRRDYWPKIFSGIVDTEENIESIRDTILQYRSMMNGTFFIYTISHMEFIFRYFLKGINKTACKMGTASFTEIVNELLIEAGVDSQRKEEIIASISFMINIRNCIHTNYAYNPRPKDQIQNDIQLKFNDKSFKFEVDKPINFVDESLIIEMANEILTIIGEIIKCPKILEIEKIFAPAMEPENLLKNNKSEL